MSGHLQRDLLRIEKRLLLLSRRVEEALDESFRTLFEGRVDIGEEVVRADLEIDQMEVRLEEECLKTLALYQPVARDLRLIIAVLKINDDLERIGDLAVNIAEAAIRFTLSDPGDVPSEITSMQEGVYWMLANSLTSFVKGDSELARRVHAEDQQVNLVHRKLLRHLSTEVASAGESTERALRLIGISHSIERVGDHIKNIAEDVIYMVEGEIVRHSAASATASPPPAAQPRRSG